MMKRSAKSLSARLTGSMIVLILLSCCLCLTTFALVYESVTVEDNLFRTGTVKINLNDGNPVVTEDEFVFAPGMTVEADFFLANESAWPVYYRLYFENVSGKLAEYVTVTVKDGDTELYRCPMTELSEALTKAADDTLKANERRDLILAFTFDQRADNELQGAELSFDFCAEAVQTRNNPEKEFH